MQQKYIEHINIIWPCTGYFLPFVNIEKNGGNHVAMWFYSLGDLVGQPCFLQPMLKFVWECSSTVSGGQP